MKKTKGGLRAMRFELVKAAAVDDGMLGDFFTSALYSLEGVGGIYRRVSREKYEASKNGEVVVAWFQEGDEDPPGMVYLRRIQEVEDELAEAGFILPGRVLSAKSLESPIEIQDGVGA